MSKNETILKKITDQAILPLYFNADETVSIEVLKALYTAGIRVVEYTNRGEAALNNFKKMVALRDSEMEDLLLGIGTIKNAQMAETYVEAGADFIICPGLVEEVVEVADKHGMIWIPGCMTPSEIIRAENLGAKMIKLFPGDILGPKFMAGIKSLFPNLIFMPTGGVSLDKDNVQAWFTAGVSAVGMGSKLVSKQLLQDKNYTEIHELAKKAIALVNEVKG
ncbi:bifunctional 4-hydroxy-2-oxoglutarate aldolase/2-dehydro-3-deoxy-phosphogluconate aldolase [Cyclobacterium marinum]|uniref:2-dehydro-3-deoxyphosphogluconate aldolase/4-hydroxy-2-oxoglutarate aldolase n=1 Tax=Cyclobacterium marinum (strain ATCC 25205 / DSM 745 / LMG 13164 / NCIMB 1802) TaxID=880070 RepID=G0J7U5_CYCMS|nr:bifunctional 4-hydroxy-2-oxoglutarate aldolase/2-dehydro-3-deoxy-phosphogluconate aldolase [Cyclobacterium marinum]AEL27793.1 2-dehydro-3-deoxyphosphogluconate aldolase/4-hydroxy-2-oxoglutarate aldolase [Cyclobacterium marinum DSM 745]MBI0397574.1 bifunctional 4-hydroxy-2-oxoglutarate aldolase/2-dehydro-3-deoxy-phosphogluconate aldolase [Cyclobacterium marinum]MBR9777418.1 bifunctional 4-hydroxy-2-oxoglutarate aldolase/2-dehydro-3-deoxy-phosphogluconate aldolase [Cytophagales bacterium]|tara:strand:+ start:55580 stop:56242 length:663 start_codon:yes stop_codon:yes gene_type:complete